MYIWVFSDVLNYHYTRLGYPHWRVCGGEWAEVGRDDWVKWVRMDHRHPHPQPGQDGHMTCPHPEIITQGEIGWDIWEGVEALVGIGGGLGWAGIFGVITL